MNLYPEMDRAPPPNYAEAVGGVYATNSMGFYPPSAPKEEMPDQRTIVTAVVPLGPNSTRTICPNCHSNISTTTKTEPGVIAYVSGALLALFGCWLGCCLIPCCMEDCMDIHHTCPECKTFLGKYKRI